MSVFTTGLQLSHQATQRRFIHGELWGLSEERMSVAWEPRARVRGGVFMLPDDGILKLEVQMEQAQWAGICPLPLSFFRGGQDNRILAP